MSARPLALLAIALLAGCGSNTTTTPQPISTQTPTPTPAPTPVPTPTPIPTPTKNRQPVGEFRFTPTFSSDGDIHIGPHESLHVNAAHFRDPDGDPLYVTVHWGDGFSNHIDCGPCRLDHVYNTIGVRTLDAEITDLKTRPVTQKVRVRVE